MIAASQAPAGGAAATAGGQTGTAVARKTSLRSGLRRGATTRSQYSSIPAPSTRSSSQPQQQQHQHLAGHESSDDEIPVPMKLSALTKALLNDGEPGAEKDHGRVRTRAQSQRAPSPGQPEQEKPLKRRSVLSSSTASNNGEEKRSTRANSVQPADRPSSPVRSQPSRENSPVRKRVVRLSATTQGSAASASAASSFKPPKRRSNASTRDSVSSAPSALPTRKRPSSTDLPGDDKSNVSEMRDRDVNTPSQQGRLVRIAVPSSGSKVRSAGSSAVQSQGDEREVMEEPQTAARSQPESLIGSVSKLASTGSRGRTEDNPALQSSMRVKRVGKIPGSFLSGPARRGRRRQSEEDGENEGDLLQSIIDADGQHPQELVESEPVEDVRVPSIYAPGRVASGSPVSAKHSSRAGLERLLPPEDKMRGFSSRQASPDHGEIVIPHYKVPPPRPDIPSRNDQENEAPPTFKRDKPARGILQSKEGPMKPTIRHVNIDAAAVRPSSPERKALGALSHNTPHRAAPAPPPKMSILDAATSTAGAATTSQAARRRNYMKVNGKCYTRIDSLGRGGSGKVYRVAADNGNMFALKRVSIEGADENTIRGFKGEIDLLKKLTSVERVITLIDYELNEEKQLLNLLLEMGELDLNKLLAKRFSSENATFDPVFVRYYWQEMLECLAAVHAYDIVHSDLKPANFVLVQGRLKLIDFGIANAIQTEETVNVHRETQIGTPNYMSPESLMDYNASDQATGRRISIGAARPKLMKLGKPSDIWSLGCILFQMVYGTPPFGHIPNQMGRCQAIINWNYDIEFRSKGLGDVPVPPSLIRTMKRCLNRDQHIRPTCEELLANTDPFLYPVETPEGSLPINEELLSRIIQSVVSRCRERMPTEAEALSVWPQAYWGSVAKSAGLDANLNRSVTGARR